MTLVHGGVGQELLDRTQAHHIPGDVLHEPVALVRRERGLGCVHEGADLGHHQRLQLLLVRRFEQARPEALEQGVVRLGLEVAESVDGDRSVRRMSPLAGDVATLHGSLLGLVDALAEAHRRQPFRALSALTGA
jgi:hypothetical protein